MLQGVLKCFLNPKSNIVGAVWVAVILSLKNVPYRFSSVRLLFFLQRLSLLLYLKTHRVEPIPGTMARA